MLKWWFSIFFVFICLDLFSQEAPFKKIHGLPTEEIYNIYAGIKGNMWVGHSQGLSRYDGHIFTHFETPDGSPLGITNICQDNQGRIWCHDFNGNIYYVEKEKMNLFKLYKAGEGEAYPAITVLDSQLIITTAKGLFVLNTRTFSAHHYIINTKPIFSKTLAISGNSVIANDRFGAYKFEAGKGLKKIVTIDPDGNPSSEVATGFNLAPIKTKDTMYAFNNFDLLTLVERNDSLKILKIEKSVGMINTITETNGRVWINTKKCSYSPHFKDTVWNRNLTDIIYDRDGNKWYSSLQDGLSMSPAYSGWQRIGLPFLKEHDFIRSIVSIDSNTIYGTQTGRVIFTKGNKVSYEFNLPSSAGAAEHIFVMPNKSIMIAPSVGLYYTRLNVNKLSELSNMATYKGIAITDTSMLIAISGGLLKLPITKNINHLIISNDFNKNNGSDVNGLISFLISRLKYLTTIWMTRCIDINYDSVSKNSFAIFKEGLALIKGDTRSYIYLNNKPIGASCVIQNKGIAYIGTLNQGLLKYYNGKIEKITTVNGLFSKTVLSMKLFDENILLIEPGYFQIYDLRSKSFTITIPLPQDNTGTVYDFNLKNGVVYLTFTNSVYQLDISKIHQYFPLAYVLSASATISNTSILEDSVLHYNNNNIQIKLSSPSFNYPEATYFMYRLKESYDTSWKKLEGPLYTANFQSLNPGKYSFEAYAINFQNIRSKNTIHINFTIQKPWWQTWLFILITLAVFITGLIFFLSWYFKRIKRSNQLAIDKLTLQNSLRKTLLRTITAQMNPHFIFNAMNTIQSFVYRNDKRRASNYLGKFSELIRKILETSNIDTITLQEEIEILKLYLDLEKARFEENFNVTLEIGESLQPDDIEVPPMFIQPYIENAIKHGLLHKKGPRILFISIDIHPEKLDYIRIIVDDNGIGRHRSMELNSNMRKKHKSFASTANESRIDLINHTLDKKIILNIIDKQKDSGTIVIIELPIINNTI